MVHSYLSFSFRCSYLWLFLDVDYIVCVLFFSYLCLTLLLFDLFLLRFLRLLYQCCFSVKLVNVNIQNTACIHLDIKHGERSVRIYSSVNQWRVSVCIKLHTECGIKSPQFPGQWINLFHWTTSAKLTKEHYIVTLSDRVKISDQVNFAAVSTYLLRPE